MTSRIILDESAINRTLTRIAHEILEYNKGSENLALLGIKTRGEFLAKRIQQKIQQIEAVDVPTGTLDITSFRDDKDARHVVNDKTYQIDTDLNDRVVIIVDDVLYTGRTVRASLDAILLHSRPKKIGLATLVDRGHRELPIRADFVGKNIPTSHEESVNVYLTETDDRNAVEIT